MCAVCLFVQNLEPAQLISLGLYKIKLLEHESLLSYTFLLRICERMFQKDAVVSGHRIMVLSCSELPYYGEDSKAEL